ncbi:MAG TPA: MFS transporter, partial [Ktedonobacterales bacterium]|nr:MFS transporter [Ktedonobacterales bacterium]
MLKNRTLLAVSLAVCAAYTGIGVIVPVRVLYAQSLGASLAVISAMASAYLIANFAAQYPSGWLADRWGRRRVMVAGLVAQAALTVAYLFVVDPVLFVVLRFAEGIFGATVLPPARALIADEVPLEQRGRAYGLFGGFLNAGFLLGPAVGGLVATTSYATAFIGAVVFRLLALAIVLLMIPRPLRAGGLPRERHAEAAVRVRLRTIFTLPLTGAYVIAFGDYLYLGFDLALLPLWMHDHLGASVAVIGLAYVTWAIPGIIMAPIGGRIADRVRRSLLILIFGLGQVPLYVAYGLANVAGVVVVLFGVQALLYAIIQPAVDAHLAAASPLRARARVQGMYTTVGALGAFVGSSVFTPLYALDFRLPLFTLGASYGLCVLIGGLMVR